jgi:hypothetical protein
MCYPRQRHTPGGFEVRRRLVPGVALEMPVIFRHFRRGPAHRRPDSLLHRLGDGPKFAGQEVLAVDIPTDCIATDDCFDDLGFPGR